MITGFCIKWMEGVLKQKNTLRRLFRIRNSYDLKDSGGSGGERNGHI